MRSEDRRGGVPSSRVGDEGCAGRKLFDAMAATFGYEEYL